MSLNKRIDSIISDGRNYISLNRDMWARLAQGNNIIIIITFACISIITKTICIMEYHVRCNATSWNSTLNTLQLQLAVQTDDCFLHHEVIHGYARIVYNPMYYSIFGDPNNFNSNFRANITLIHLSSLGSGQWIRSIVDSLMDNFH